MELLAPAGNMEALYQAIANGADAVYLGYTAFSARQGAGNFNEQELNEATALCHLYHVRVYVALNTLIKESEWPELVAAVKVIEGAKADAVIVQDLGVAAFIRESFPLLPIHASTQMALHNVQGVRFAKEMGFTRVVLARECSLKEIELCCQEGLEIEIFVHGAMCVSQSGECLFSSMVGGRSGNRGRCAQPCRMDYRFEGKKGACLSPRDIMLREQLPLLQKAGVTSLKIEGRLKRPEYVSEVTASYRRALDGTSLSAQEEKEKLLQIFNRGGFMQGHVMGQEDGDMVYPQRVNHLGVPLGQVMGFHNGMARILLNKPIHNGDALHFEGNPECEAVYSGKDLPTGATALCRLRENANVPNGAIVSRLVDNLQMLEALKELPKITVDMQLQCMPGSPLALNIYGTTVYGDMVAQAQKAPATKESLEGLLRKTGGTSFVARGVSIETENAFAPVSAINQLRRDSLEAFARARAEAFYCQGRTANTAVPLAHRPIPPLPFSIASRGEAAGCNLFYGGLEQLQAPAWLCLPTACTGSELENMVRLAENNPNVLGLILGSIGQWGTQTTLPLAAGEGIPAWNRLAAQTLIDLGFHFIIASPELSLKELEALKGYPLLIQTTGRVRLMTLSHCPRRTAMGLKKGRAACRMCDNRPLPPLVDRMNESFPLRRIKLESGCKIEVLSSKELNNLKDEPALKALGFCPLHEGEAPREPSTKGHLYKPVE